MLNQHVSISSTSSSIYYSSSLLEGEGLNEKSSNENNNDNNNDKLSFSNRYQDANDYTRNQSIDLNLSVRYEDDNPPLSDKTPILSANKNNSNNNNNNNNNNINNDTIRPVPLNQSKPSSKFKATDVLSKILLPLKVAYYSVMLFFFLGSQNIYLPTLSIFCTE